MNKREMYSGLQGANLGSAGLICDYAYTLFGVMNDLKGEGKAVVRDLKNGVEQGFDELVCMYLDWLRDQPQYQEVVSGIDQVATILEVVDTKSMMRAIRQWYHDLDNLSEEIQIPRLLDFVRFDSGYLDKMGISVLIRVDTDANQVLDRVFFERLQHSVLSAIFGKDEALVISEEILKSVIQIGNLRLESGSFASA